jgi:hypothetical protein
MRLLAKFAHSDNKAEFTVIQTATNAIKRIIKPVGAAVETAAELTPAHISDLRQLAEEGKNYRNGMWNKAMVGATALSVPLMAAPLITPDASTKALQKLREEDKLRESKGLPPLTQNTQLANTKLPGDEVENVTTTKSGIRTAKPKSNKILPGELPPGSLAT